MIRKGILSYIDIEKRYARVIFKDIDDKVSYTIKIAFNIGDLHIKEHTLSETLSIGDEVLVAFWNNNLKDGAIIAKL